MSTLRGRCNTLYITTLFIGIKGTTEVWALLNDTCNIYVNHALGKPKKTFPVNCHSFFPPHKQDVEWFKVDVLITPIVKWAPPFNHLSI